VRLSGAALPLQCRQAAGRQQADSRQTAGSCCPLLSLRCTNRRPASTSWPPERKAMDVTQGSRNAALVRPVQVYPYKELSPFSGERMTSICS